MNSCCQCLSGGDWLAVSLFDDESDGSGGGAQQQQQ